MLFHISTGGPHPCACPRRLLIVCRRDLQTVLTVLANFHGEGHLAYPALRSVMLAAEEASRHGIPCRVVGVIDRGDAATREQVGRFRSGLDALYEVDYGDVSCARNHGIDRIDTKYVATFDGDDLFDRDWLWRGVQFLESLGDDNAVGHTEVRLTFGSEKRGRLHVPTDSPLFHPLHLISSWLYAADLIAPTHLYKEYPFAPNDHARGLGAEDWYWTCESIIEGVRHVIVPQTTYFYRRQPDHLSLGMVPGATFRPTRLLDKRAVGRLAAYPSASVGDHPNAITGQIHRWPSVPLWLAESVRRACEIDLGLYELHHGLASVPMETPDFFPAVGRLYLRLMDQIDDSRETVLFFCEDLGPREIALIDAFRAAHQVASDPTLNLLIVAPPGNVHGQTGSRKARADNHIRQRDAAGLRLRHVDLGNESAFPHLPEYVQHGLIVRFLLQARPRFAVNLGSGYIDRLVGIFGRAMSSGPTRTARVCRGREAGIADAEAVAAWQALTLANANYSLALCQSSEVVAWLNGHFHGAGAEFRDCAVGRGVDPNRALGRAIHGLIAAPAIQPTDFVSLGAAAGANDGSATRPAAPAPAGEPDVTCIVPVRAEGYHLNQTLRVLAVAFDDVARCGLKGELVIVTDGPGERTSAVVAAISRTWPEARIISTDAGGEAAARNAGIAVATGRFVAMFAGSDIVSPGWLARAVRRAEEKGPRAVVHPQAVVEFAAPFTISYQPDMDDAESACDALAAHETWTVHALAQRDLFRRVPYRTMPAGSGYGHSVWHWNCETVMAGCRHLTVPETAVYRRAPCFAGEHTVALGRRPETTLPPTRFLTEHPWLARQAVGGKTKKKGWSKSTLFVFRGLAAVAKLPKPHAGKPIPDAWDDEAYLSAYPDVRWSVAIGRSSSGYDHYCRNGRDEGRVACWRAPGLIEEMRALSLIDPGLGVAAATLPAVRLSEVPVAAGVYRSCRAVVSAARPTHLFLAPSLRPGGAELSMLHCVGAVLSQPDNRALLITTENDDSRWLHRLPAGCAWLPFAKLANGLPAEERMGVLTRLLTNSGARCLHLFYSEIGWRVLRRHAPALAAGMQMYVSLFSLPPVDAVEGVGYTRFLGELGPYLSGIVTDNRRAAETIQAICGIPSGKIAVVRHPVDARQRFTGPIKGSNLVLWASRLDRDKRPDILEHVARRLTALSFHVYGDPVLDDGRQLDRLRRVPNIVYGGSFCGFDTIQAAPYRCLLYTSRWDGLPNVVLEAMRSGLLVVAPALGGIPEIIGDDRGVLVRAHDDPDAFAAAIERIGRETDAYRVMAEAGRQYVTERHTHAAFIEGMKAVPGYLRSDP